MEEIFGYILYLFLELSFYIAADIVGSILTDFARRKSKIYREFNFIGVIVAYAVSGVVYGVISILTLSPGKILT